ncbi:MAG: hypothetical protein R2752_20705 [Vicinamibacterales bacterium]
MTAPTASHRRLLISLLACLAFAGALFAQGAGSPDEVNASTDPMLRGFSFRSIGPATMMGRLDDIEAVETDPFTMYLGFATGGVWKTTTGGATWTSLFDEMPVSSIGDIAIAPSDPNVVYVGTGEPNNRQSSTIGGGVWGTRDGGDTWTFLGLEQTQSIGRIVVSPTDPNTVYVAAVGHLFGPNEDRGLYKSTDGGKTWKNTKFINADTGFTDVAIDPKNPKVLYAAAYQRRRTWWGFNGGPGGGLYKSTDAGDTWTKVEGGGFPAPPDGVIGRIGITIHRANPNIVYMIAEVGAEAGIQVGVGDDGGPGNSGDAERTISNNPNRSGVWRSNDAGKTWTFLSNVNNRPVYYSQIRVDPVDPNKLFQGGATAMMSTDGGKNWSPLRGTGHGDYHAIYISPKDPKIVAVGHDGGLDISYDGGYTWDYHNDMALGQFYQVSADMRRPYYVCGGLQDNGSWCGPSAVRAGGGRGGGGAILNTDWFRVGGGDGFYTRQDPTDWATLYSESQNGAMSRLDLREGTSRSVRPSLGGRGGRGGGGGGGGRGGAGNIVNAPPGDVDEFRFYWNTPIELSPHDPSTLYTGAQFFMKSNNRGDTWWMNPLDLSKNVNRFSIPIMGTPGEAPMASKHDGYSNNSLITVIAESPVQRGVIWVGTDDGNLHLSRDGGETFTNVFGNITGAPTGYVQVSRIEASHFAPGTAYVALDNHRNDDWKPYLFRTTDFGRTWTSVVGNLPEKGNVNAVREDLENPNLIFVGTEFGLYVTLDGGREWKRFSTGLPTVRVDDLLIHPRDRDLIVATHGRSLWIADDITPLEQLNRPGTTVKLFEPRPAIQWKSDTQKARSIPARDFAGDNPQGGTAFSFWASADMGEATIEVLRGADVISTLKLPAQAGMNRIQWSMREDPPANAPNAAGAAAGAAAARGAAARWAVAPVRAAAAGAAAAPRRAACRSGLGRRRGFGGFGAAAPSSSRAPTWSA